jgi:hypothetical protein
VAAVGKVGEALEWIERARGRLYDFHQVSGHADLLLGESADALDDAGQGDWAERLRDELVGRNVIEGRWTFQILEEYDDTHWWPARAAHEALDRDLVGGARHVVESEMKECRRTPERRHHEQRPPAPTADASHADRRGRTPARPHTGAERLPARLPGYGTPSSSLAGRTHPTTTVDEEPSMPTPTTGFAPVPDCCREVRR